VRTQQMRMEETDSQVCCTANAASESCGGGGPRASSDARGAKKSWWTTGSLEGWQPPRECASRGIRAAVTFLE
jgi:hypothetical protein